MIIAMKNSVICTICSNGCRLVVAPSTNGTVAVSGNRCNRGLSFARETFKTVITGRYFSVEQDKSSDTKLLKQVLGCWDKVLECLQPSLMIHGSPERSDFRTVVCDTSGSRFIVEQIRCEQITARLKIAHLLQKFSRAGLPVTPYRPVPGGSFIAQWDNQHWMLTDWVSGKSLKRNSFWDDGWRGKAAAEFLTALFNMTSGMEFNEKPFDLLDYAAQSLQKIKSSHKALYGSMQKVEAYIFDTLGSNYCDIPVGFCHGDPHPLNMIWGEQKILSVIDWEFCGVKPILYDAALIIGCVATEHPKALYGQFLSHFVGRMRKDLFDSNQLSSLIKPLTVALRIAWLNEWLRRNDEEMVRFEVGYMEYLMEHLDTIIELTR